MKIAISFIIGFLAVSCAYAQAGYGSSSSADFQEVLLNGVPYDCQNKPTGPNKDGKYCDVFHACVFGKQKKTYGCPQVGNRFCYNPKSLKCELATPSMCPSGNYYQPMQAPPPVPTLPPVQPQPQFPQYPAQPAPAPQQPQYPPAPAPAPAPQPQYPPAPAPAPAPAPQPQYPPAPAPAPAPAPQPQYPAAPAPPRYPPSAASPPSNSAPSAGAAGADNSDDLFILPDSFNPCVGQADDSFVPSKYANVFHRCVSGGVRKDFRCAKGSANYDLWWDQANEQCNYPCLVQTSLPIFMSQLTSQQIQMLDRQVNGPICTAGNQAVANAHPMPGYGK